MLLKKIPNVSFDLGQHLRLSCEENFPTGNKISFFFSCFLEDMETGEVSRQARPRGFGEAAPITADQLASAIASAQTALGMPTPSSPGRVKVLKIKCCCVLFL